MDLIHPCITYRFIRDRTRISWQDVRFGLANDLLAPAAPQEMAVDQLAQGNALGGLKALADPSGARDVSEIVQVLARAEPPRPESEVREKWLYLVLAWYWENRTVDPDPLQRVEEVYADFDYPKHIAGFVRYMTMEGPDLGSREANESRLFDRWKRYLDQAEAVFAAH